jgi:hypothetical protein
MNRRQKRMMEREYNKKKSKLIKNLTELNVPTESDIEEYITSKSITPKIIEPIRVTQEMSEELKEYYNTK